MFLIKGFFTLRLISVKALGSFQSRHIYFRDLWQKQKLKHSKQWTAASWAENWLLMSIIHRAGKPGSVLCKDLQERFTWVLNHCNSCTYYCSMGYRKWCFKIQLPSVAALLSTQLVCRHPYSTSTGFFKIMVESSAIIVSKYKNGG